MAKLNSANLAPDAYPRLRGVVIAYDTKFGVVAAKWPKKRGTPTNPNVIWTSKSFSLASQMAANSEPMQMETARFLVKGTVWLPRDVLVMAAFGKAYEITGPDGEQYSQAYHGPPVAAPPVPTWVVSHENTFDNYDNSFGGYTNRQVMTAAANLAPGGYKTRITFHSSLVTAGCTINNAWCGIGSTSGDLYDFASTPTQIKFGGNAGVTIGNNQDVVSDEILIAPQAGENFVIAFYMTGTSGLAMKNTEAGMQSYYKFANDASTINASGYTLYKPVAGIRKIETLHDL